MVDLIRITRTIEVEVTDGAQLVADVRGTGDEKRLRAVGALRWPVGRPFDRRQDFAIARGASTRAAWSSPRTQQQQRTSARPVLHSSASQSVSGRSQEKVRPRQ